MAHTVELISEWGTGGVIFSPRDLTQAQLVRCANNVREAGGRAIDGEAGVGRRAPSIQAAARFHFPHAPVQV